MARKQPIGLLNLPVELRNLIFSELLVVEKLLPDSRHDRFYDRDDEEGDVNGKEKRSDGR